MLIRRITDGEAISWWDDPETEEQHAVTEMFEVPDGCEQIHLDMTVAEFMEEARSEAGTESLGAVYVEDEETRS